MQTSLLFNKRKMERLVFDLVDSSKTRMSHNDSLHILERAHSIIEIERLLTETLEHVKPWLPQATNARNVNHNRSRVRPIPRNIDEAQLILSVARNLAARTSAPAGWNPNAPVVGFSTPSPLPHQLRGGSLATLQLERARQVEREKKRQRIQLQQHEQQKQKETEKQKPQNEANATSEIAADTVNDAHRQQINQARMEAAQRNSHFQQQQRIKPKQDVSMNLSDDDSDSNDDDENEDIED